MVLSAFAMGAAGLLLSFFPQEISTYLGSCKTQPVLLLLLGALYFSFAMVNWTAKANLIGGIYSKPISTGNFAHFLIGSLAFDKLAFISSFEPALVGAGLIYSVFAILFGYVFFTHPG
ncbi:hypothetical protein GCM10027190_44280 [Spirosoma areae]